MDLRIVDTSATRGASALHRCGAVPKLFAFALVLTAVIVSANLLVVLFTGLVLLGVVLAARLPLRPVLALAAYPGLFAALFAFAAAADPLTGALVVAKAVTAALAAVVLMFTTPYPQVFAPLQRVLPSVVGDALLMTYRSLFLLLDKFAHVLTAAKLRAGFGSAGPVRTGRSATRALGSVLLYSLDMSQRTYDVMRLRGYDRRLIVEVRSSTSRAIAVAVVAASAAVTGIAAFWRLGGAALAPFAWIPLLLGCVVVAAGFAVRLLQPEGRS